MISVEAHVIEVINGHIRKILIGNEVYEMALLGSFEQGEPEEVYLQEEADEEKHDTQNNKGRIIKEVDGIPVYENIYFDIRALYTDDNKNIDVSDVIRKYYPGYTDEDIKRISNVYKNYSYGKSADRSKLGEVVHRYNAMSIYSNVLDAIEEHGEPYEKVIRAFYPHVKYRTILSYANQYRKYIQDRKNIEIQNKVNKEGQDENIGYDDAYKVNIKKNHVQEIKRCLHKFNFIATSDAIEKETRIPKARVRATLHWMIGNDLAKRKYRDDGLVEYLPA